MPGNENEIVSACQKGHLEDFSILYDAYVGQIYHFIFVKVFDKETAEDITSEVFFKALNKIGTYNPQKGASFKTWLFKIAYNSVIDYCRMKREKIDIDTVIETCGIDENFGKNLDDKEKVKKILTFLDEVKPKVKEIMILRFWDELSFQEIADITGESLDNCKKIVSRTVAKIQALDLLLLLLFISI